MTPHGRGPILLSRYLALAWLALLVYGSLHPFTGWRDTGLTPLAFLEGGWPRYWTAFDLLINVALYLPLGFFTTLAMCRLPGSYTGAILATLIAAGVSFGLETLQTWLPARVPSNLDLACNSLGGLVGVIAGQLTGPRLINRLIALEHRLIAPVPHAELGMTLLGLWLLIQFSPETLLFGSGDLRYLLGFSGAVPFAAESFVMIEASIVAFNAVAVGLIVRHLCARLSVAYLVVPLFLLLCLAINTLAAAILVGPGEAFAWLTPGARLGLPVGGLVLLVALALPATPRLMLIALALMATTVLVNLAPPNPYSAAALAAWRQGHFLNFNGLTRLAGTLWPFLTLPYLLVSTRRH
ncbi:VanZ family protein [Dechloromonas sp.]|uniref:VanZ family protein n=1 Tax=Dechloromonas sp. TaxID=1917218 RepID=UPI001203F6EC|nr:VanZ family protein [Dechloromonas sp.]MBU3695133.1 VanZ family protein [Dechloromonas sp.]TEX47639.1 MAG: teicoplanin resistance protein VanZ [Rhodocyclaceae bacterium]